MGLWTCKACAVRLNLDTTGQASAPAGWCAAGGHQVKDQVRWAPFAAVATSACISAPPVMQAPAPLAPAVIVADPTPASAQGVLF